MTHKILLVEDEQDLCEILKFNIELAGFEVDAVNSAEEAQEYQLEKYDLLLLDIMLPGISGLDLARIIRKDKKLAEVTIIFLTARDAENDVITGLTIGADDYIAKPFSNKELIARMRAVLRRTSKPRSNKFVLDQLVLDVDAKTVYIDDEHIGLSKLEFSLLELFFRNPNRIFSREEIIDKVWGEDIVITDRTIDVHITRLRKKIGDYSKHIVTRQGYGYGMV